MGIGVLFEVYFAKDNAGVIIYLYFISGLHDRLDHSLHVFQMINTRADDYPVNELVYRDISTE